MASAFVSLRGATQGHRFEDKKISTHTPREVLNKLNAMSINPIENLAKAQRERSKLLIIHTCSNIINAREKPRLSCHASVRLVILFA